MFSKLSSLLGRPAQGSIAVQASSFKPQASSSIRGQVKSSASTIGHEVKGDFSVKETSRNSQAASSVIGKEGVKANQSSRSDHVSPPRALGG